jgi:hypothetical protein
MCWRIRKLLPRRRRVPVFHEPSKQRGGHHLIVQRARPTPRIQSDDAAVEVARLAPEAAFKIKGWLCRRRSDRGAL